MSGSQREGSSLARSLPRRTFLKVAGLTSVGVLGASRVLAAARPPGDAPAVPAAEAAPDPLLAKAVELEFDQDRIFRFVADEIAYEPYAGVLRGAAGTLAGRAGNSMDKALLLAGLLAAAAIPVRFRQGTLSDDQAAALLAGAAMDQATTAARLEAAIMGAQPPTGPSRAATPEEQQLISELPGIVDATTRLAADRIDRATAQLVGALTAAGVALGDGGPGLPEMETTRHTWVQAASGPDWVDLDATLPDAVAGAALGEPAGDPVDALPDDVRHRVDFVVTSESVNGGALQQLAVIEHSAFADELAGQPINLTHEKPEGLKGIGFAIESIVTGGIRYQPILSVGDAALVGIESLRFGNGGGVLGESGAESTTDGEATAEWLDVRVVSPDRERSARRTLFDRIGDQARASGAYDVAALAPVELVDIDSELTEEFLPLRVVHFLDVATGTTNAERFTAGAEDITEAEAFALYPATYHLLRDTLGVKLGLPRGARTFLDAPNLVDYSIALRPGAAASAEEKVDLGVDLLVRSARSMPLVGAAPSVPPLLTAGVLEHEAERLAAGDGLPGDSFPALAVDSVGAVFEAAAAQGVSTRVIRDPSEVSALPIDPDVALRLAAGLQGGWLAVVPERPVSLHDRELIGWWLVDPASGAAVDVFQDGRGSAATEEAFLWNRIAFWVRKFVCLGLAIKQLKTFAKLIGGDVEGFVLGMAIGVPLHKVLGGSCH